MSDVTNTNSTPITNTQPDTNLPPATTTVPQPIPPKYAKSVIRLYGLDSCGHCADTEKYIKQEVIPNADVPVEYTKIDVNSPEGQLVKEEKKLKHVPYVEQCLIPTEPTKEPECKTINEYKKDFFKIKVNSTEG